jgi:hypothetical protein
LGWGATFWCDFLAEFLTWFFFVLVSFFGVRSAHFGWFFQDMSSSRWSPASSDPPASSQGRAGSLRQGGHSLDRRVWVTVCLLGCGWWFFGGSEVFRRIFVADEVSDVGACSIRRRHHLTPVLVLASV